LADGFESYDGNAILWNSISAENFATNFYHFSSIGLSETVPRLIATDGRSASTWKHPVLALEHLSLSLDPS
jgi:hypothetical protein